MSSSYPKMFCLKSPGLKLCVCRQCASLLWHFSFKSKFHSSPQRVLLRSKRDRLAAEEEIPFAFPFPTGLKFGYSNASNLSYVLACPHTLGSRSVDLVGAQLRFSKVLGYCYGVGVWFYLSQKTGSSAVCLGIFFFFALLLSLFY